MTRARSPATGARPSAGHKTWTPPTTQEAQPGYHGYKLSISVDMRHKFIRKITTGTASEHDSTHFDNVLVEHSTSGDVSADRGYRATHHPAFARVQLRGCRCERRQKSGLLRLNT
ncbi:MAG: transposase [Comamonadaceae bacterium]|nr:transposase [Comamonadaceae bacterium]